MNFYTGLLDAGQMGRGDVVGFSESTEFKIKIQPSVDGGIFSAGIAALCASQSAYASVCSM